MPTGSRDVGGDASSGHEPRGRAVDDLAVAEPCHVTGVAGGGRRLALSFAYALQRLADDRWRDRGRAQQQCLGGPQPAAVLVGQRGVEQRCGGFRTRGIAALADRVGLVAQRQNPLLEFGANVRLGHGSHAPRGVCNRQRSVFGAAFGERQFGAREVLQDRRFVCRSGDRDACNQRERSKT